MSSKRLSNLHYYLLALCWTLQTDLNRCTSVNTCWCSCGAKKKNKTKEKLWKLPELQGLPMAQKDDKHNPNRCVTIPLTTITVEVRQQVFSIRAPNHRNVLRLPATNKKVRHTVREVFRICDLHLSCTYCSPSHIGWMWEMHIVEQEQDGVQSIIFFWLALFTGTEDCSRG